MSSQRFHVLDTYRFIAALCVIVFHLEGNFQPFLPHSSAIFEKMHLFVDFFFVLSGFVLMHTYGTRLHDIADMRNFIRKRLARVYPLHALMTLVFVAISLQIVVFNLKIDRTTTFDISLAPAHLLLLHAWGLASHMGLNSPSWSISAEFFVYLLFPLFLFLLLRFGPWKTIALAVIFALLMSAVRTLEGMRTWTQATEDFGNFRAVPSFMVGMALCVLLNRSRNLNVPWWLAHGAAAFMVVLMLVKAPSILIVGVIPGVIFLIAAAEVRQPRSLLAGRVGQKLGEASYGAYLLHALLIIFVVAIFKKLHHVGLLEMITGGLAVIIAATGLALLSFRYFENPLRIYFGRDPAKRREGAAAM